jgi:hypothetical protein
MMDVLAALTMKDNSSETGASPDRKAPPLSAIVTNALK